MSNSVRLHRRQPTRLRCPWDSPGKNTGVGCHFLLQCMKVKSESEVVQSCPTLRNRMDCNPPGSSVHGIFPGKSTGVGAIAFSGLVPDLRVNAFNFSLLRIMFAVGLSYMAFIMLLYVPYITAFWRVFIIN